MKGKVTIRDIAGFCPEEAVWKMMADVSAFLLKEGAGYVLTPDAIVVDGKMFMVEKESETQNEFLAPEQHDNRPTDDSQMVWSLGAVAYYAATGHVVFGGHGGSYQSEHPSVALPTLPKGLQLLTPVLQKCLCYIPDERISMMELNALSLKGLTACGQRQRKKCAEIAREQKKTVKTIGEKWPEEMIEQ